MEEPQYGGLIDKHYFYQIGIILLMIIGVIIIIMLIGRNLADKYDYSSFCDYDSCSQESDNWIINGSKCFDRNNTDCQDFLRLWEVCQSHKRRIGSC